MSTAPGPRSFSALPALARLNLVLLAGLTAAVVALLYPHWRENADLSHGYLMPVIFVFLLREARSGPARFLAPSIGTRWFAIALLLLGLLALVASGLYAAALDWTHSLVAFTLTVALVLLLGGALLSFATSAVRFVPFNWTACVAIGLWLLCAPIPPGSYTRLTLSLQLAVTENVLRALHLLGIAANRHGNIIDLATTSVGVEEACSGVRSLISCLFAALLLSATLVRRPWARVLLIGLAAPLAIAMNFARSLTLTLLANSGVAISGAWHDVTGYAVLGVTAAVLVILARYLERPAETFPPVAAPAAPPSFVETASSFQITLSAALAVFAGLAGFFFFNTRPSIRQNLPVPDLAAILPAQSDGWQVKTSDNLYQFSQTLKTDHLAQRTYLRSTAHGVDQLTIYLAYWRAGQAPVSLVASHTPDACWPGSGWVSVPSPHSREVLTIDRRTLAEAESRHFQNGDFPQYVWFWHLYDGRPIAYRDPYSPRELLRIAWRYGFTHDGDQLFVRISSNRQWSEFARDPLLTELFSRLRPLGL